MNPDLLALGLLAIGAGLGTLYAARRAYPRLDVPQETLATLRVLTASIAGILLLLGIGLVLVGLLT